MGIGLNWQGMADGYQGFKSEQRRLAEDERRAAADAQALKDQAYQEETRNRQRYDWSETDRKKRQDKESDAAYLARFKEDAPPTAAAPVAALPADVAPPAGPDSITTQAVPDLAAGISALPPAAGPGTAPAAPFTMPADVDPGAQYMTPPGPMAKSAAPAAPIAPVAQAAPTAPPTPAPVQQGNQAAPLNNMTPAQKAKLLAQAEAQFGMRHGPGTAAPSQSAAPSQVAPVAAPPAAVFEQASGMPKPRPMSNILDMLDNRITNAARRGDSTTQEYAAARDFLTKARSEGVIQAVGAWVRGDYPGGMKLYNDIGQYGGAKIIGTPVDTTTVINGVTVPTHIIQILNEDGSSAIVNTAQDEHKLQSLADRVKQGQEAGKLAETSKFHTDGNANDKAKNEATDRYQQGMLGVKQRENEIYAAKTAAEAKAKQDAPIWTTGDDDFLTTRFTSKDEVTGKSTFDGEAFQFTKALAVPWSRDHGGDSASARAYAMKVDTNLRLQAKDNPEILRKLRQDTLRKIGAGFAPAAPPPNADAGKGAGNKPATPTTTPTPPPAKAPANGDMMEQWVNEKLMGAFDGPAKYAEIAKTNPNPAIRKAAAALYAKSQQAAQEPQSSNAL